MVQPKRSFAATLRDWNLNQRGKLRLKGTNFNLSPETIGQPFSAQVPALRFLFLRGADFDIMLPNDGLSQDP
jgi:hypothetical protein